MIGRLHSTRNARHSFATAPTRGFALGLSVPSRSLQATRAQAQKEGFCVSSSRAAERSHDANVFFVRGAAADRSQDGARASHTDLPADVGRA